MNQTFLRRVAVVAVAMTGGLAVPGESYAIFGWFCCKRPCCQPACAPNSCAPAYVPPPPAVTYRPTCCPQTCNYVPTTCYRTQVCNMPVTTYQPVQSCDPCTGCPRTSYRPVTTMVQQVQRIPYTTYRLVYSNPCNTCGVAPTTVMSQPGCSSCNAGTIIPTSMTTTMSPPPAVVQPSYAQPSYVQQSPTYVPPVTGAPNATVPMTPPPPQGYSSASPLPSTGVPSLNSNPGSTTAPRTYPTPQPTPAQDLHQKPIPDPNLQSPPAQNGSYSPSSQPDLRFPEIPNSRTTYYPPAGADATAYRQPVMSSVPQNRYAAPIVPVKSVVPQSIDRGWRPALR